MKPRDVIEEMLIVQMAWTHARLARLSAVAMDQTQTQNVRVVNEAADRAANTFRRQMLALAEYRKPPRSDAFVAIKQANVAAQQVVQNLEIRITKMKPRQTNKGPSAAANDPTACPLEGLEIPAGVGRDNGRGGGAADQRRRRARPIEDERDEARGAQGAKSRATWRN